jgi:DNA-binding NarL/FixJ family response regulator
LQLVAEGKSNSEIAKAVHLSRKTVETYRYRLMRKLKIESLPELVRFAASHGLIRSE